MNVHNNFLTFTTSLLCTTWTVVLGPKFTQYMPVLSNHRVTAARMSTLTVESMFWCQCDILHSLLSTRAARCTLSAPSTHRLPHHASTSLRTALLLSRFPSRLLLRPVFVLFLQNVANLTNMYRLRSEEQNFNTVYWLHVIWGSEKTVNSWLNSGWQFLASVGLSFLKLSIRY